MKVGGAVSKVIYEERETPRPCHVPGRRKGECREDGRHSPAGFVRLFGFYILKAFKVISEQLLNVSVRDQGFV